MNFNKLLDHCLRNKILDHSLSQFSFLGDSLQENLRKEWMNSCVIRNPNTLFVNKPVDRPDSHLTELFVQGRNLIGWDNSITLANSLSKKNGENVVKDVKTLSELLGNLPVTHLHLWTLIHPSVKTDEFHRFQKTRRLWWKSYLQQPVLLDMTSSTGTENDNGVEQIIEFGSKTIGTGPFEVIQLYRPQFFDSLQLSDEVQKSLAIKLQRKSTWPSLMTSKVRLESAVWFFLADAFHTRNKTSVLSLHKSLAPYPIGILIEGESTDKLEELQDLRRLLSLDLKQSNVPVLPLSASWTTSQCDSRGIPYLICLSDSTLEQGVCGLRSRDTTLKEEVHVGDVVDRLKRFIVR